MFNGYHQDVKTNLVKCRARPLWVIITPRHQMINIMKMIEIPTLNHMHSCSLCNGKSFNTIAVEIEIDYTYLKKKKISITLFTQFSQ